MAFMAKPSENGEGGLWEYNSGAFASSNGPINRISIRRLCSGTNAEGELRRRGGGYVRIRRRGRTRDDEATNDAAHGESR